MALPDPASGELSVPPPGGDRWAGLRRFTQARIALGRTGGSLRTESVIDFRLGHARARDAVHAPFDPLALAASLRDAGIETFPLATEIGERRTYLARPDLGRKLDEASQRKLRCQAPIWGNRDLAILVSDGLSALAAERQAVPLLAHLLPLLHSEGWSLYPVLIVPFARVKLQDEVGELLGARQSVILLGERPGFSSIDSLGAYLTYRPNAGRTDADRNCLSNIRPEGLPPVEAAVKLADLLIESARRGVSGVALKDLESPILIQPQIADR